MFSRTTIMKALGVGALLSCFTYLFFSNNRIYVGSSDETRYWLRKHLMYWVMEANRWCDNTSLYRMLEFFLTGLAGGYFVVDMMENDIVEQKEIPLFEETSIRQNLLFPTFEEILTEIAYPIEDIPQKFRCPITHSVMNHPIFLSDGYTYDEEGVEEWLQTSNKSPMTNLPLENKTIT
ncbi:MAG TPA: U-box domain-containing protein, partial [Gammaproteobacteria bacterium]|nr:U-box domain-containing protein [Gammaproteobacteria bacterium]